MDHSVGEKGHIKSYKLLKIMRWLSAMAQMFVRVLREQQNVIFRQSFSTVACWLAQDFLESAIYFVDFDDVFSLTFVIEKTDSDYGVNNGAEDVNWDLKYVLIW